MPFITVNAHSPADYGAAFAAENATIAGSVRLERNSSVWYGAVLRADTGRITIGENSNVQDNAVLHTGPGLDVTIGRGVSIGHGAIVHGCTVGDNCLIGMHATILNGAVIGAGSLIAAGALVPEKMVVPAGSLVIGVPGKVMHPVSAAQAAGIKANEEEYLELAKLHAKAPNLSGAASSTPRGGSKTTLCKAISMGIAGQNDRIREGRGPGMPGPYRSINQKRMPSTKQHPL